MTDGTKTACTGVEVVVFQGNGPKATNDGIVWQTTEANQSQGWTWGPRY